MRREDEGPAIGVRPGRGIERDLGPWTGVVTGERRESRRSASVPRETRRTGPAVGMGQRWAGRLRLARKDGGRRSGVRRESDGAQEDLAGGSSARAARGEAEKRDCLRRSHRADAPRCRLCRGLADSGMVADPRLPTDVAGRRSDRPRRRRAPAALMRRTPGPGQGRVPLRHREGRCCRAVPRRPLPRVLAQSSPLPSREHLLLMWRAPIQDVRRGQRTNGKGVHPGLVELVAVRRP